MTTTLPADRPVCEHCQAGECSFCIRATCQHGCGPLDRVIVAMLAGVEPDPAAEFTLLVPHPVYQQIVALAWQQARFTSDERPPPLYGNAEVVICPALPDGEFALLRGAETIRAGSFARLLDEAKEVVL